MHRFLGASTVLSIVCFGCASDGGGGGDDQQVTDGGGTPDSPALPSGYTRLIGRTWSVPSGKPDTYKCVRFTVAQDTYVTGIAAQAPFGTHHTVLSIAAGNAAGPDGEYDCSVGAIGRPMLYASGVGTAPLNLPANVGLKIAAGTQVHMNLHLFNATDQQIVGESAILIRTVPTQPPMLAEMIFAGKLRFTVAPGQHDITGGCTVNQGYQLFAYWPHMHALATHAKLEHIRGSTTTLLHDADYSFTEQQYYERSPELSVQSGDQIRVTCHYNNTTGADVGFGDGANEEMCFVGVYRYPSQNASITQCTDWPFGIP